VCADLDVSGIPLADNGPLKPGEDLDLIGVPNRISVRPCSGSDKKKVQGALERAFSEGGAGLADRRLYKYELTIGPLLWDSLRHHPSTAHLASVRVSRPFPRYLLPLRMRRIVQSHLADGSATEGENGCTVTYAKFRDQDLLAAAAALGERYHGAGELAPVSFQDLAIRLIPNGGTLEGPIFIMRVRDRRLFLQFDGHHKLCYVDDFSATARDPVGESQ
jgi:hypothetical protein